MDFALQCATDIAIALRQLHNQRQAHGSIGGSTVLLRETSARLAPPYPGIRASQESDIAAFGSVLYQLVHGGEPPAGFTATRPPPNSHRNDNEGLAAAVTDLAYRCMASCAQNIPDMQKVLTEVRLLAVMSRHRIQEVPERRSLIAVPPAVAPQPRAPATVPEPIVEPAPLQEEVPASGFQDRKAERHAALTPTCERCPKCSSNYVYGSKARDWVERRFKNFAVPLYRCHRCYHRYFIVLQMKIAKASILP